MTGTAHQVVVAEVGLASEGRGEAHSVEALQICDKL